MVPQAALAHVPRAIRKKLLFDADQRTGEIAEISCVKDLNAGVVLPIERGRGAGAISLCGVSRRVEPKPEVVHLHRIG